MNTITSSSDINHMYFFQIHRKIEDSFYKAVDTHNVRLQANVRRWKLPRDTFDKWKGDLKKQKKLRWFVKPVEAYEHCRVAKSRPKLKRNC